MRMSGIVAAVVDAAAAPESSARLRPVASITSRSVSETCNGEWDGKMERHSETGLNPRVLGEGPLIDVLCLDCVVVMRVVQVRSPRGARGCETTELTTRKLLDCGIPIPSKKCVL